MNPDKLRSASIGMIWLVHVSAIIGITLGYEDWFVEKTPFNLLLIFVVVAVNFPMRTMRHWIWFVIFFLVGYLAEWLGVHHGLIFGDYTYGDNLGWKLDGIPLMIGVNWAVLIMITGAMATRVFSTLARRILGGAGFMVFLDLFMEQVAPRFDFWVFAGGEAPVQNYFGWFAVAALLHAAFQKFIRYGDDIFSMHVYGAQLLFFVYFFVIYGL